MDWKLLVNLSGLNYWVLISSIGLNLVWTFITLIFTVSTLSDGNSATSTIQLDLMLSIFLGAFISGWITGKVADDSRGPTYGFIGSLGSATMSIFVLLPAGMLGLLVAGVAIAGGINGGLLSLRRRR